MKRQRKTDIFFGQKRDNFLSFTQLTTAEMKTLKIMVIVSQKCIFFENNGIILAEHFHLPPVTLNFRCKNFSKNFMKN